MNADKRLKLWVAVGIGACVTGAALWFCLAWTERTDSAEQPEKVAQSSAGQKTADRPIPHLPKILTAAELGGAHQLSFAMTMDADASERASYRVAATLQVAPLLRRDGANWLPLRLVGVQQVNDDAKARLGPAPQPQSLEHPWVARLEADGRLVEQRFGSETPVAARSVLAALGAAMQFTRPADGAARSWQVAERDLNDIATVQYRRADQGRVEKVRATVAGAWPAGKSTTEFQFAGAEIRAIAFAERGQVPIGSLMQRPNLWAYAVDIAVRRIGPVATAWANGLDPATMRAYAPVAFNAAAMAPTRPTAVLTQEIAQWKQAPRPEEFVRLRDELTRSLQRDPAGIAGVVAALQSRSLHPEAQVVEVAALVSTRTEPGFAAVADMLRSVQTEPVLLGTLLQAVTLLDRSSPLLLQTTREMAVRDPTSRVSAAAAAALGSQIAQANVAAPDAAADALAEMIAVGAPVVAPGTFAKAGTPEARLAVRTAWLAGFANVRHPAVLPVLLAALNEGDELVRAHAAAALHGQHPAAFLDLMVEMMAKEQSSLVRDELVSSMQDMGPELTLPLVTKALRHDKSVMVRLAAVKVLGAWMTTAPGVRKVLQEAFPHEKSSEVAASIKEHLTPGTSSATAKKTELNNVDGLPPLSKDSL